MVYLQRYDMKLDLKRDSYTVKTPWYLDDTVGSFDSMKDDQGNYTTVDMFRFNKSIVQYGHHELPWCIFLEQI